MWKRRQAQGGVTDRMSFGAKLRHDGSRYERERRLLSNVISVGDFAGVYDRHTVDSELTCGCHRARFCAGKSILRSSDSTLREDLEMYFQICSKLPAKWEPLR